MLAAIAHQLSEIDAGSFRREHDARSIGAGNDDDFLLDIHAAFPRSAVFILTTPLKPLVQADCRPDALKNRSQTTSSAICPIKA